MKTFPIVVILCVLCASSAYSEKQPTGSTGVEWQNWSEPPNHPHRLGPGDKVDRSQAVPVYWCLPEREYYVIGVVTQHGDGWAKEAGEAKVIQAMARAAKIRGADAIIMLPLVDHVRNLTQGNQPFVYAWATAIKWGKPPEQRPTGLTF
jgi:hypothetical protein